MSAFGRCTASARSLVAINNGVSIRVVPGMRAVSEPHVVNWKVCIVRIIVSFINLYL
jgi:hypothetical protein